MWGKTIGAFVGGAIGGFGGAAAGGFIGHLFDEAFADDDDVPELLLESHIAWDRRGLEFVVAAPEPAEAAEAMVSAHVKTGTGDYCKALHAAWADDDGDFVLLIAAPNGAAFGFVPYEMLAASPGEELVLEVKMAHAPAGELQLVGGTDVAFKQRKAAEAGELLLTAPLLALCAGVMRADGRVDRDEVAAIRQLAEAHLDFGEDERPGLKRLLKNKDLPAAAVLVPSLIARTPMPPDALFDTLAHIAASDGHTHEAELAYIREVLAEYGVDDTGFEQLLGTLDEVEADLGTEWCSVLGIEADASKAEIKSAYREKMKAYHPDRVAELPEEFQALAHEKSLEIKAAYEGLMAQRAGS